MHILLTDILICPVCGPGHGLILLADRIVDRRVEAGALGCPNCRRQYPVTDGFAELRVDPARPVVAQLAASPASEEEAVRLAALMGVTRGPGYVVIVGEGARPGAHIAAMIPELQVIACSPEAAAWPDAPGVNRMAADVRLPFFDSTIRAVALTGGTEAVFMAEAIRVLAPGCRLVLDRAPGDASDALAGAGMRVLARQKDTIVAAKG
ncbi:MAG TPA: Trm112 family protein [Longimicrobiales bacterium]|nr:Trm112 family protein [Longimicrobiales bacterium]